MSQVQIPALHCIHALVICHAENTDLIWRAEIKSFPCTENLSTFDRPAYSHKRGDLSGKGQNPSELEKLCTVKKTALLSTSGRLMGYHSFRQERCTSESSDILR